MLDRVEAGKRVRAGDPFIGKFIHQIELVKVNIANFRGFRPDIDHVHLPEDGEAADEPVQSRTDIDVASRTRFVNPAGDQLILEKVCAKRARRLLPFRQDGEFPSHGEIAAAPCKPVCLSLAHVARPATQSGGDPARLDAGVPQQCAYHGCVLSSFIFLQSQIHNQTSKIISPRACGKSPSCAPRPSQPHRFPAVSSHIRGFHPHSWPIPHQGRRKANRIHPG